MTTKNLIPPLNSWSLTVGIADIPVVEDKAEIIEKITQTCEQITKQFRRGSDLNDEQRCYSWRLACSP